MRLAFFGYAWNVQGQPDAYMSETLSAFAELGFDVDLILGNQITRELGVYGLNDLPLADIAAWIGRQDYDLAVSFNNSMLLPEVLERLTAPVISIVVDEPEHLFAYRRGGLYDVFEYDIQIVALSSPLAERLEAAVPNVDARLHFLAPATRVEKTTDAADARYPISWVASLVGDLNLKNYFELMSKTPVYHDLTRLCLEVVSRDGDLRALGGPEFEGSGAGELIAALPWPPGYFEMQMQNILTNRRRVSVVERLAPHGLALFGNAAWRALLSSNAGVMDALRAGPAITSHLDLRRVYDASRISINVPQVHTAPRAIQYRVLDIMASNSLLITQGAERSDLQRIFGPDCPVPTFRDLHEMERLCLHYLGHEDERRALVQACNAQVATGFSFRERALDLLKIVDLAPPDGAAGTIRTLDLRRFAQAASA